MINNGFFVVLFKETNLLNQDQITALYVAVYGRAPDTDGMNYWLQAESYADAAAGFVEHAVFTQEYGNDTNREMVEKFYTNIFGSAGDKEGIDFWAAQLDQGVAVNQILAGFLDASLSADLSDNPEGLMRQNTLKNKINVANYYHEQLGDTFSLGDIDPNSADIVEAPDFKQSHDLIENITADLASVTAAKDKIDLIVDPDKLEATTVILNPQAWSTGYNSVSFILEFDSEIKLGQIQMLGSGSTSLNYQSVTQDGMTIITARMSLMNGEPAGSIGIGLGIPASFEGDKTLVVKDFTINRTKYPDASNVDGSDVIEFNYADLIAPFTVIDESLSLDTSGYDTFYDHINEVLSLPNSKVGLIENNKATDAYLHIAEGERFVFDYDTFVLRTDSSATYRLKFTPEDSSLFGSNIMSKVYKADGSGDQFIMNAIGDKNAYVDGSLYSSPFFLEAGEDKFLDLAMRWSNKDDARGVAEGPAPYQVELIEVVGVMAATHADDAIGFLF